MKINNSLWSDPKLIVVRPQADPKLLTAQTPDVLEYT